MKQVIVFTIMVLQFFFICVVSGQDKKGVGIDSLSVKRQGDSLVLDFRMFTGQKAAMADRKLIITPVLQKGKDSVLLKPVIVRTRRTAIMDNRNGIRFGDEVILADNGQQVEYSYSILYQDWMNGARVYAEQLSAGCGKDKMLPAIYLADNLTIKKKVEPSDTLEIRMLEQVPAKWIFSRDELAIDYEKSSAEIDLSFFENRRILEEMSAAIDSISKNPSTSINRIEITGYASPEGPTVNNIRLGEIRAEALKSYLQKIFPYLKESDFQIKNGGENWDKLRKLVADSDMEFRKDVLYIIDNVPEKIDIKSNTSRKKQLMNLNGGRPYNYMYKTFFSKLRNACYIAIYYNTPAVRASIGVL